MASTAPLKTAHGANRAKRYPVRKANSNRSDQNGGIAQHHDLIANLRYEVAMHVAKHQLVGTLSTEAQDIPDNLLIVGEPEHRFILGIL
ncbi:MAG TPA: hypothetical protein PK225_05645 [Azonexus sp.]|jgi:hypothetical protein|nr:hypothetical protein [Azonexus sp.]